MKQQSSKIFLYSVLFTVFFMAPAFASSQFGPYPLLKNGDMIDFFTPLVLLPLSWAVLRGGGENEPGRVTTGFFMVSAALWVMGHGLHLAANAIKHLLTDLTPADLLFFAETLASQNTSTLRATDIYALTDNFDERLGHLIWHTGIVGLAAVLLRHEKRSPPEARTKFGLILPAGILHGFTLLSIFIEGQTVFLGLPFSLAAAVYGLTRGRQKLRDQPLRAFFTVVGVFAAALIIGWCLYWGNTECGTCPEFFSQCVGLFN